MKRFLLVAVLAVSCSSCAFMNPRNRPLMNFCERHLVPDGALAQALTAPLTLPTCLVAGVLDTAVIHPIAVLDEAAYDTAEILWVPTNRGYVTECALFPLRLGLSPVVWSLQYTSRVLFDVPPRSPSIRRLERELLSDDPAFRLAVAKDLQVSSYRAEDVAPATDVMLKACQTHARDLAFCSELIQKLPAPLTDAAWEYLGREARAGQGPVCAVAIWRLFMDCWFWRPDAGDYAAAEKHLRQAVNRLAPLYDDLVKAGHHEAEVYLAALAGDKPWQPGPRALTLYITRSLAKRAWPDYSEIVAFKIQSQLLLGNNKAALIDAVDYEWRALRLTRQWPKAVLDSVLRMQRGAPANTAALIRLQDATATKLRTVGPGQAADLLQLTEELVTAKTLLDAEELAERLLKGPKADLDLFLGLLREHPGDPRAALDLLAPNAAELLRRKGQP